MDRNKTPKNGQGMLIAVGAIAFLAGRWSAQAENDAASVPVIPASQPITMSDDRSAPAPVEARSLISSQPERSTTVEEVAAPAEPEFVYYRNCSAARAAGVTPIREGSPGYAGHLDRDGDGVACE